MSYSQQSPNGLEFGVWGGAWGLGFGVFGLGFRVWGLGLGTTKVR